MSLVRKTLSSNNKNSPFIKTRSYANKLKSENKITPILKKTKKSESLLKTPDNSDAVFNSIKVENNELKNRIHELEAEKLRITAEIKKYTGVQEIVGPSWVSDESIRMYFDIISNKILGSNSSCKLVSPVISQAIKILEDTNDILDPLFIKNKDILFLPVNDAMDVSTEGGSHWSLLIYCKSRETFYYYDSLDNKNLISARKIAEKLSNYLAIQSPLDLVCMNGPTQDNSFDCGIYMLLIVDHIIASIVKNTIFSFDLPLPKFGYIDCLKKRTTMVYILLGSHTMTKAEVLSLILPEYVEHDRDKSRTNNCKRDLCSSGPTQHCIMEDQWKLVQQKCCIKSHNLTPTTWSAPCRNQFSCLSEELCVTNNPRDGISQSECEVTSMKTPKRRKQQIKQQHTQETRGRVLVVADSHGRHSREIINEQLQGKFSVTVFVKPNAKFGDVTKDLIKLTSDFTTKDYVVIVAGTNDVQNLNCNNDSICPDIENVLSLANHTNVLYPGVPLRYDNLYMNKAIMKLNKEINCKINRVAEKTKNIVLIDNIRITRLNHTKHGLHFNRMGKIKFWGHLARTILQHSESKLNQNNSVKRSCNIDPSKSNEIVNLIDSSSPIVPDLNGFSNQSVIDTKSKLDIFLSSQQINTSNFSEHQHNSSYSSTETDLVFLSNYDPPTHNSIQLTSERGHIDLSSCLQNTKNTDLKKNYKIKNYIPHT